MNCFDTQSYIMQYVSGELSGPRLEGFLEHIEKCSYCKEELEIYYTLLTGMKQLDEDKEVVTNYHLAFENQLLLSKKLIEKNTKGYWIRILILDIMILMPALFMKSDVNHAVYRNQAVYEEISEEELKKWEVFAKLVLDNRFKL